MTYVVTENCIRCKYMDCVEVCPVDCFYAGENMLVICHSDSAALPDALINLAIKDAIAGEESSCKKCFP